jgi:hypothetical protein
MRTKNKSVVLGFEILIVKNMPNINFQAVCLTVKV